MPDSEQTPQQVKLKVDGNPETDPESARLMHTRAATALVYRNAIDKTLGPLFEGMNAAQSAFTYAADVMDRMEPRDPMEEMLVSQAMCAHARVLRLTDLANRQTTLAGTKTVHEYADKASNTYRRLMLALAEYRKPPKAGDTYTAIQQANIAGQQVVMNDRNRNTTNEQGCSDGHTQDDDARQAPPALPPLAGGAGVPACVRIPDEAMGAVHRAEDG